MKIEPSLPGFFHCTLWGRRVGQGSWWGRFTVRVHQARVFSKRTEVLACQVGEEAVLYLLGFEGFLGITSPLHHLVLCSRFHHVCWISLS